MIGLNNEFVSSKEEYEIARLTTKCAGLQGKIDDQAAEIARLNGEYQEVCRLVAQMHLAAVGGAVGPKLGVIEDVAALRELAVGLADTLGKYKAICDQLGNALQLEYKRNVDNYHGASSNAKEALAAWRAA